MAAVNGHIKQVYRPLGLEALNSDTLGQKHFHWGKIARHPFFVLAFICSL